MKKITLVIFIIVVSLYGCNSNSGRKDFISEYEKEEAQKQAYLTIASDSTVRLSFSGLALGEPAIPLIDKAVKNKTIWRVIRDKENKTITAKSNIFLPKQETPICVDVRVTTFHDSISSIAVISTKYDTHTELIDLYASRYDEKYSSSKGENHSELWSMEDNIKGNSSESKYWTYKNQTIYVSNYYDHEEVYYVKNPNMKSPENRYGKSSTNYFKSVVILYRDIDLCKRADDYQKATAAKKNAEEQKEREVKRRLQSINTEKQDI